MCYLALRLPVRKPREESLPCWLSLGQIARKRLNVEKLWPAMSKTSQLNFIFITHSVKKCWFTYWESLVRVLRKLGKIFEIFHSSMLKFYPLFSTLHFIVVLLFMLTYNSWHKFVFHCYSVQYWSLYRSNSNFFSSTFESFTVAHSRWSNFRCRLFEASCPRQYFSQFWHRWYG